MCNVRMIPQSFSLPRDHLPATSKLKPFSKLQHDVVILNRANLHSFFKCKLNTFGLEMTKTCFLFPGNFQDKSFSFLKSYLQMKLIHREEFPYRTYLEDLIISISEM